MLAAAAAPPQVRKREIHIDETLLPRIAQGDRDAFCLLYEQSRAAVYAYCLSLTDSREDAEDAMQETYLKIRAAAHLYRPQGKPMAWIFTIARNFCLMKHRERVHVPMEELERELGADEHAATETRLTLEAALCALSGEEREIVVSHALGGMKHREIAERLRLPLSTVLSKYNRGLEKMRRRLEGNS